MSFTNASVDRRPATSEQRVASGDASAGRCVLNGWARRRCRGVGRDAGPVQSASPAVPARPDAASDLMAVASRSSAGTDPVEERGAPHGPGVEGPHRMLVQEGAGRSERPETERAPPSAGHVPHHAVRSVAQVRRIPRGRQRGAEHRHRVHHPDTGPMPPSPTPALERPRTVDMSNEGPQRRPASEVQRERDDPQQEHRCRPTDRPHVEEPGDESTTDTPTPCVDEDPRRRRALRPP